MIGLCSPLRCQLMNPPLPLLKVNPQKRPVHEESGDEESENNHTEEEDGDRRHEHRKESTEQADDPVLIAHRSAVGIFNYDYSIILDLK